MEFTYKAYEMLIEKLLDNNYTVSDYHDYVKCNKVVILRHDVDSSLDKAMKLAEIENSLGVSSTYFVLLTSDFYNIASKSSYEKIHRIKAYGHEIGLHFDEVRYNQTSDATITEMIIKESKIVEDLLDIHVSTVSMHRPSKRTLEADYKITGMINSYSKEFFDGFKYVSDSRRHWRENIHDIIESGEAAYNRLHILTHPFWYNDKEKDLRTSIRDFVNSANKERYAVQSENIRGIEDIMRWEEIK